MDKETLIGQLSFIKDASEIVKLKDKEDENKPKAPYDDAFGNNEINDANEDTDDEETNNGTNNLIS